MPVFVHAVKVIGNQNSVVSKSSKYILYVPQKNASHSGLKQQWLLMYFFFGELSH